MASITLRIDDELMAQAYKQLERLGVTPSELIHQVLQYVAEQGRLPSELAQIAEEDEDLIATVNERLTSPQRMKMTLDDL
ncbi:type II toxin-antitoxin system RelB/DinJ family antitoxin [Pseudomonas sp. S37]|uniref:type II toxin-antitoxin system RelB/DinJ family antitoxin n=1 Tax=Pseudomonas sp. S37 TaxID=2767449 RepID=UPI001913FFE8|nr:type II toxin-antitoxin system RelB/DinJ family antitoxin [Pseudomonas sp. S37]MBK4996820.1 type II toxin-antitoxin system RelB/DinJ family antitoxin [Pseudomonas sp. S37]